MFNLFIYSILAIFICISHNEATETLPEKSSTPKIKSDTNAGKLHFQTAIDMIQHGNIEEAIGYLRAAYRTNPKNIVYLTNLGVAEMNLGEFHKSFQRLLKALRMDSSFQPAIDNFNILKEILKERDINFDNWYHLDEDRIQKHTLNDLKRIHINDLFTNDNEIFYRGYQPFVLEGSMDNTWDLNQFSLNKIKLKYSNYTVSYYPHGMKHRNVGQYFRNLSHALEELDNPTEVYHDVDASKEGGYVLFNLPKDVWEELTISSIPSTFKTDDEWLDECFDHNEELQTQFQLFMHWRILIIGERNSGMFNHQDTLPSASFHVQLSGTKRWHLCPPTNTPYMYEAADVDWFHPNYETHPLAIHAECYQVDLKPGEIIFYPKHYWHQTLNLEKGTVSITGTLVNEYNWRDMVQKLSNDCEENKGEEWSKTCVHLKKCFLLWKEKWP